MKIIFSIDAELLISRLFLNDKSLLTLKLRNYFPSCHMNMHTHSNTVTILPRYM